MSKDSEKSQITFSVEWLNEWLKALLKLFVAVIIPYEIFLFVLWKLSVLPAAVSAPLGLWGAFAITFVWATIRTHRAANKENQP